MHTLYASGFMVYFGNVIVDWWHTYSACEFGGSTSFEVDIWLVLAMAAMSVTSTTMAAISTIVCVEQPFRNDPTIESTMRRGCTIIFDKCVCHLLTTNDDIRSYFIHIIYTTALLYNTIVMME